MNSALSRGVSSPSITLVFFFGLGISFLFCCYYPKDIKKKGKKKEKEGLHPTYYVPY